ncbi:MAG: hypothetical protein JXA35_00090 [Deltaproteobacteria bacterium]|nr:hypothetical protein [Deltaproteobacteria bacterium]
MVDNINIPKILSPLSSTAKTRKVSRDQGDKQQRSFYKHLKGDEGEDENNTGSDQDIETEEIEDIYERTEESQILKSAQIKRPEKENEGEDDTHGRLIDILV